MKDFADNLKRFREQKGFTRKDMADRLKMSQQAYGCYELNKREPDLTRLRDIADLLEVSVDDLTGFLPYQKFKQVFLNLGENFSLSENGDAVTACCFLDDYETQVSISFDSRNAFCEFVNSKLTEYWTQSKTPRKLLTAQFETDFETYYIDHMNAPTPEQEKAVQKVLQYMNNVSRKASCSDYELLAWLQEKIFPVAERTAIKKGLAGMSFNAESGQEKSRPAD